MLDARARARYPITWADPALQIVPRYTEHLGKDGYVGLHIENDNKNDCDNKKNRDNKKTKKEQAVRYI
jgi:hypothetical protein